MNIQPNTHRKLTEPVRFDNSDVNMAAVEEEMPHGPPDYVLVFYASKVHVSGGRDH